MKIRELSREADVDVIEFYWIDDILHFLVIPYDGYEGVIAVTAERCKVTCPIIDNFIYKEYDYGGIVFVHELASDGLIERMINHEPGANAEFLERVRRSGL